MPDGLFGMMETDHPDVWGLFEVRVSSQLCIGGTGKTASTLGHRLHQAWTLLDAMMVEWRVNPLTHLSARAKRGVAPCSDEVDAIIHETLPYVVASVMGYCSNTVLSGVLRGANRQNVGMYINLVALWLVSVHWVLLSTSPTQQQEQWASDTCPRPNLCAFKI